MHSLFTLQEPLEVTKLFGLRGIQVNRSVFRRHQNQFYKFVIRFSVGETLSYFRLVK